MCSAILTTKLHTPPIRSDLVSRSRLVKLLNEGVYRKLTLVSAPAGFGKTTLVSEWISDCNQKSAWLQLDESDNEPAHFFAYFIAALQRIESWVGDSMADALQSPLPPPSTSVMAAVLNDINRISQDFILVLDDYHLVDSPEVDEIIIFLLEHMPPHMHMAITTREDPPLPLARMRARDQLTELRAADLRFTPSEAADFLNQVMGLNLPPDAVSALEQRTEGWIAGLQLAALSMQKQADKTGFIASFTGTHRFVLDYLVEEVLEQQPENIKSFLLQTAVLDRLTGPLCDALTGQQDGQQVLEHLERANLFVVPLDDERQWYRYHHLFAELLRQRLHQKARDQGLSEVEELHQRASKWYEENGRDIEAFHHACAAQDIDRAELLMEGNGMPLYFRGAMSSVLNWLESLPPNVFDSRPSLWVSYATASTIIGRPISNVEEKLRAAEIALQSAATDARTKDLVGQIAANRAMLAIPQNDINAIIVQSRRALENLHPDNLPVRTTANWALGYAYQLSGDRSAAKQAYSETIPISRASGNTMITIGSLVSLGQVQESDTQLSQASETYHRVFPLVGDPPLPGASEAHLGLARIYYQWNNLEAAQQHASTGLPLARQLENVDSPGVIGLLVSRIRLAQGDLPGALSALTEAEQFFHERKFEHRLPEAAAMRILILLHENHLQAAENLAGQYDLPLSTARVHLAQNNAGTALEILEPYYQSMAIKGWGDGQLSALVLKTLAYYALGEADKAVQTLSDALVWAVPEGYIRLFIDEGKLMRDLLSLASARGIMPEATTRLLEAFKESDPYDNAQPLLEPLSQRELEILKLIAEGLSNHEIGERLFLALDTVKGHNRRIFAKLQVRRRTEAVMRARELDLVP